MHATLVIKYDNYGMVGFGRVAFLHFIYDVRLMVVHNNCVMKHT